MTSKDLAQSYLRKSIDRLDVLDLLFKKGAYSDVVREAQEIVELSLKGMLRAVGIEPPKFHDVGSLIIEHKDRFKGIFLRDLKKIAKISKELRKERELAFYGDIDFIPTEEYGKNDATKAMTNASWVVDIAKKIIRKT
jgi:HEPN domain-containing protein